MKRILIALSLLLTLATGSAQLKAVSSPSVQQFMAERSALGARFNAVTSTFAPTRELNGTEMADAFIGFSDYSVLSRLRHKGVIIHSEYDDFVTAQVPVNLLQSLTDMPGVTDVEICRMMEFCTDSTLNSTKAGMVLDGTAYGLPQAYDGTGVIIGVIDTGFDYQHRAFRAADDPSRSRIVRVYDPNDASGHPAIIDGNRLEGSVFMGDQIYSLRNDGSGTHGTHTAGVAAGTHVNGYGGMAPGADIVLCTSRNLNSGLSELELIDCVNYIYSYADSVGKPCVISVSVSTAHGPHDGLDRVSKAIAKRVGPGHIFVIAAGNNGVAKAYSHGPATTTKPFNMLLGHFYNGADDSYYYVNTWFDTWVRAVNVRMLMKFHILDKQTNRIVWESDMINLYKRINSSEFSEYFGPDLSYSNESYLIGMISQSLSGKFELTANFFNLKSKSYSYNADGLIVSRYQIGISVYAPQLMYPRQPDSCYIDSWVCTTNGRRTDYSWYAVNVDSITENGDTVTCPVYNYYALPSNSCSIGTYAVNDSIISVGSYTARNTYHSLNNNVDIVDNYSIMYEANNFSGFQEEGVGPTGAFLPTVTAPGANVVSSVSRYSYFGTENWNDDLVMRSDDGSLWGALSGTSMATPAVAGIIAQWLQANPNLSAGDIKNVIAQTSVKDEFFRNPRFGPNGKIDAMAGIRYILGLDHEEEVLMGDINDDGFVTVKDVTPFIEYLMSGGITVINEAAADVNQDGKISIKDVVAIIDMLMHSTLEEE